MYGRYNAIEWEKARERTLKFTVEKSETNEENPISVVNWQSIPSERVWKEIARRPRVKREFITVLIYHGSRRERERNTIMYRVSTPKWDFFSVCFHLNAHRPPGKTFSENRWSNSVVERKPPRKWKIEKREKKRWIYPETVAWWTTVIAILTPISLEYTLEYNEKKQGGRSRREKKGKSSGGKINEQQQQQGQTVCCFHARYRATLIINVHAAMIYSRLYLL